MFVTVITGPPGAGKSTTAGALQDRLWDEGRASALIEVDELARCCPLPEREQVLKHVRDLARSYEEIGHDLLFVTDTCETDEWYAGLAEALPEGERLLVLLNASGPTLRSRVTAREPAQWSGLDELLAAAERLGEQMRGLAGVDVHIDTEHGSAAEAVDEIYRRLQDKGLVR